MNKITSHNLSDRQVAEALGGSVIEVTNVSKKYCKSLKRSMIYGLNDIVRNSMGLSSNSKALRKEEFWAVRNVSFEARRGETLGIIGPNGSGKTTLLKMLNGIFWPDTGKITIKGRVGGLIEVGAGFHPLLTGRENVYLNSAILGMRRKKVDQIFDDIITFADIGEFVDVPVKFYSSGMYIRLGFSVAVHCDPDILLIDEVLAVGDEGFQSRCLGKIGKLKENGTTTLMVSHNMHHIAGFSGRVLLLDHGLAHWFDDVSMGVKEYQKMVAGKAEMTPEKICSGGEGIKFRKVEGYKQFLDPGDAFEVSMEFESLMEYQHVEVACTIFRKDEAGIYFTSSNKASKKRIDLRRGRGTLKVRIDQIPINNSFAKIVINIWSDGRTELLFWWRIPVEFSGAGHGTGKNSLSVAYQVDEE